MEEKIITTKEWNEFKSLLLDVQNKVTDLVDSSKKELLTPKEVCEYLKICRSTYQNYIRNGIITQIKADTPKGKRAYVKRSELERLIEGGIM